MNEEAEIVVLEKGGFISFANCGLPYYLAGRITSEEKLLITTPQQVRQRFNIDARVNNEVLRVDRANRRIEVIDHGNEKQYTIGYDKLILATGAMPIVPAIENVPARNVFLLRTMEDAQAVHKWLAGHDVKSVVIVGAGFIGLEMAEGMRERDLAVTLVEKASHVLPPIDAEMAPAVADELARHDVRVITGDGLKALHAAEGLVNAVETESGIKLLADIVLLSIGVRPNVALAKEAGIKLGESGAIAVDEFGRTSDLDIYAVGDVSEVTHGVTGKAARIPLAGPANRQGRIAGEHAATGAAPRAGKVLGTAIVKVFDLTVAVTGLTEEAARKAGFDVDTAYVLPKHHAGYYPGAVAMRIKLVYDKPSGRVLGAQIVGSAGVDKRIDVLATTIYFGGTVEDLSSLDLAYAPQFGSAKDALHYAGMVAQNQRRGVMPAIEIDEISNELLIDVRTPAEFSTGSIRGAINLPLDQLRENVAKLDRNRSIVTLCQIGQRGYVAQRILQQRGFRNVRNLKGGISTARFTQA
jgi:NADPH-dependent 2,4-dienoyl-CoA reductase/sulfur reductase-like enzyme/rhodanese-related sulfurtransferase